LGKIPLSDLKYWPGTPAGGNDATKELQPTRHIWEKAERRHHSSGAVEKIHMIPAVGRAHLNGGYGRRGVHKIFRRSQYPHSSPSYLQALKFDSTPPRTASGRTSAVHVAVVPQVGQNAILNQRPFSSELCS
jgi:hypothetical protein